jgi:hypothetical protein
MVTSATSPEPCLAMNEVFNRFSDFNCQLGRDFDRLMYVHRKYLSMRDYCREHSQFPARHVNKRVHVRHIRLEVRLKGTVRLG